MAANALAYSPVFFLIKAHLEEVNLPLRVRLHGLIAESAELLKKEPSELRSSLDLLISQFFDTRIQALKWLSKEDGDIDFSDLYEEIYADIRPFISDQKYGLLAENCLFALRSNLRVLKSVLSQIGTAEMVNGIQDISEIEITYEQLRTLLKAYIPLSQESNTLIKWIDSSLRVEFVLFAFAIIRDSGLDIRDQMVEELSAIVVDESHQYYALAKVLGLVLNKVDQLDNYAGSPDFLQEQRVLSELGLDDFVKTLDS